MVYGEQEWNGWFMDGCGDGGDDARTWIPVCAHLCYSGRSSFTKNEKKSFISPFFTRVVFTWKLHHDSFHTYITVRMAFSLVHMLLASVLNYLSKSMQPNELFLDGSSVKKGKACVRTEYHIIS